MSDATESNPPSDKLADGNSGTVPLHFPTLDELPDDNDSGDQHAPSVIAMAIKHGDFHIHPVGLEKHLFADFYHRTMQLSWARLGMLFVGVFIGFNLLFAVLYSLDPSGIASAADQGHVPQFWRLFFFSVATVATIGYGNAYPVSAYDNIVVVVEITLGIVYFSLSTGLAFSRFSRPTARILFTNGLVIRDVDGTPTLMLRAANQRHNMIYQAQAQLSLLTDEDVGGISMRRFVDLPLARASNPAFALTWTIMHPIGPDSPLRPWYDGTDKDADEEIVVFLSGIDESSGQTIHGRWAYGLADTPRNARFVDIVTTDPSGVRTIDYRRFHETIEG